MCSSDLQPFAPQYNMPYGQQLYIPPPPPIGSFYQSPIYPPGNTLTGGPYGLNSQPILPWLDSGENPQLPFLAALDIPDIHKLTNDPINHNSLWPPVPHKIPSDISKFDGKQGDDPAAHIIAFHLWSISNYMVDDSVQLCLKPKQNC